MPTPLRRLQALCRQWGGQLVNRRSERFWSEEDGFPHWPGGPIEFAPFARGLAVQWDAMQVFYRSSTQIAGMIHEMGHVFACPLPPNESDEFDFFGWEYAMAIKLEVVDQWTADNKNYSLGGDELGDLDGKAREAVLGERIIYARSIGILDGMEPKPIRLGRGGAI